MKTCSKCNQEKPLPEFKKDKRRLNGSSGVCKPCSRLLCKEWRGEKVEHCRSYERNYRGGSRKITPVDAEKHRTINRLWERANPEKLRVHWRNKRARKRAAEGKHSLQDINKLIILQKNRCAYCKKSFSNSKHHVDHIVPLALGGSNWAHNLQLLCPPCNMKKAAKDPVSFSQELGLLI